MLAKGGREVRVGGFGYRLPRHLCQQVTLIWDGGGEASFPVWTVGIESNDFGRVVRSKPASTRDSSDAGFFR